MNPRKITVIQTKGQGKVVFMSGAERLGELKADLRENKISYDDMIFYEGLSRTELVDDASILPKDVPFKGELTNELVIYLTLKNKKIRSGMPMTRSEVYSAVKDNNLGDAVKEKFNKNFTQVSTSELEAFITEKLSKSTKATAKVTPKAEVESKKNVARPDAPVSTPKVEDKKEDTKEACESGTCSKCAVAMAVLLDILEEECTISEEQKEKVLNALGATIEVEEIIPVVDTETSSPKSNKLESSFSDADLRDLAPKY